MRRFSHLGGTGVFGSDDDVHGIRLWNRLEFRRGKGWAEVTVMSMDDGAEPRVIRSQFPNVVTVINWIMDVIIECGGEGVEPIRATSRRCPPECEDGYIRMHDGNYEPCPVCSAEFA